MKKRSVVERRFKCPECGTIMTAYKSSGHKTAQDHKKHMWCYKCQKKVAFVQLSKWE